MSAELHDVRAKLTTEAYCAIAAYARAHDVDKGEVVRDVLHRWAVRQIHSATMLQRCLKAKGVSAAWEGIAGQTGESLDWGNE